MTVSQRVRIPTMLLWAAALLISNLLLHYVSPHPGVKSGNGIHPKQMLFMLCSAVLAGGWLRASALWVYGVTGRLTLGQRLMLGPLLIIVGASLIAYAVNGVGPYNATVAIPMRGIMNQYALRYWAYSLPFWLGLLCVIGGSASLWLRRPQKA